MKMITKILFDYAFFRGGSTKMKMITKTFIYDYAFFRGGVDEKNSSNSYAFLMGGGKYLNSYAIWGGVNI